MSFVIDTTSYPKAVTFPQRHGYQLRGRPPASIVVHSTEGSRGQSLDNAARFLYTSADVSAHFLIGRGGEIIQFLDPKVYQAWHAGGQQPNGSWTAQPAYSNPRSIGIECLHVRGETWPSVQRAALGWLLVTLMAAHQIPTSAVESHGQIALPGPYQRKQDPTDWPYGAFRAWVDALAAPLTRRFVVRGLPIYQRQDLTGLLAGQLVQDTVVEIDATYPNGAGHLADGRGFVDLKGLEAV